MSRILENVGDHPLFISFQTFVRTGILGTLNRRSNNYAEEPPNLSANFNQMADLVSKIDKCGGVRIKKIRVATFTWDDHSKTGAAGLVRVSAANGDDEALYLMKSLVPLKLLSGIESFEVKDYVSNVFSQSTKHTNSLTLVQAEHNNRLAQRCLQRGPQAQTLPFRNSLDVKTGIVRIIRLPHVQDRGFGICGSSRRAASKIDFQNQSCPRDDN